MGVVVRLIPLILALPLVLLACGPRTGPTTEATLEAYPTVVLPPDQLGGDFAFEQEVTMEHPEGSNSFRAVLQKQGEELLMLGLAPHGARAFLLRQNSEGVSFESYMPFELPFPPEFILYDVHRTWFMSAQGGSVEREGERITERVENGRVMERTFERLDGVPEGTITVTFEGGLGEGSPNTSAPPERVVLDNGWFGYRATVRTLSWQSI